MAIGVRVVGIFFKTSVDLGGSGTVKECLDAAMVTPGAGTKFRYLSTTSPTFSSPTLFSATYDHPVPSPVLGTRTYPPGTYTLQEHLTDRPSYTVWQYYIFDENNVFVNRGRGAIPFNEAVVEDGQSVTWRLLQILAEPTDPAARMKPMLAGNPDGNNA